MTADEIRDEVLKWSRKGLGTQEIVEKTGLSRSTVKKYKNAPQPEVNVKVKRDDILEMKRASLKEQLRRLEAGEGDLCEAEWSEERSLETYWKEAEEDNGKRIEKAIKQGLFRANLPAEPVAISFISDQHISVGNIVDLKRMRADAELIAQTPGVYAILGGDGIDNHIRIHAAIMAARSQPGDQYELYSYYLSIFSHKILAAISGNHDAWSDQVAGVDMVKKLAAEHKICYAPAEARIECSVGQTKYKVAVRHQYRMNSTFNLGHSVKQWWRMGDGDFDIGCICHHHEPHIESFQAHGDEKWACRPGSYQITSSYSRQYGFNNATPTCPTFILYPDRKEVIGFRDIRPALRLLKAERA